MKKKNIEQERKPFEKRKIKKGVKKIDYKNWK